MRARLAGFTIAALSMPCSLPAAKPAPVEVRIDSATRSAPVSRYEYGMFIEPIGTLVARSFWAEMLDDRKFYADVLPASVDPDTPARPDGPPISGPRKWRPLGGDDAVRMDRDRPLAGKQSASVTVGAAPRGLMQGGIGIAAGRKYVGSLWLRGDPGAKVQVALVWGEGPGERIAVGLPTPGAQWQKASFEIEGRADASNARFEISGTGTGRFSVAAVSLMPADNIRGWRADTTALARSLNSGMWRLPGGNFLSNWDWHEALGDRDRRNPMLDRAWSAIQSNDFGMDEWMDLCRIIGVDPYVTVNAGLGDANSAAELVEYLNGSAESHWGGLRAANGHPAPYGVHYWNIGNEPYGDWQIGATTRDYFMLKHREFADRMLRADPSIVLIGSGAMPDQRDPPGIPKVNPTIEDIRARFGNSQDWTFGLFDKARGTFSGVTEHWYDRAEKRPEAPPAVELQEWTRSPANQVRAKAVQWDLYRARFPWIDKDRIFLWIDEYAYIGGASDLKLALAYGMVLNEMLRHTDFMTAGAFTAASSTMDISPNAAALNTTGLLFQFYGAHFGAGTVPLAVAGNTPVPKPQYAMGAEHPLTIAGSDTYPVDVVAALSPDGKTLKLAIVNPTIDPQPLKLALGKGKVGRQGSLWVLSGPSLDARNDLGKAPRVTIAASRVATDRILLPPTSVSVVELPFAGSD